MVRTFHLQILNISQVIVSEILTISTTGEKWFFVSFAYIDNLEPVQTSATLLGQQYATMLKRLNKALPQRIV